MGSYSSINKTYMRVILHRFYSIVGPGYDVVVTHQTSKPEVAGLNPAAAIETAFNYPLPTSMHPCHNPGHDVKNQSGNHCFFVL